MLNNPKIKFKPEEFLTEEEIIYHSIFSAQRIIDDTTYKAVTARLKDLRIYLEQERRREASDQELTAIYTDEISFLVRYLKESVMGKKNIPICFDDSDFLKLSSKLHNIRKALRLEFDKKFPPEIKKYFLENLTMGYYTCWSGEKFEIV